MAERKASGESTPEQVKRLRRIRRLIKNREYAAASRNKKRELYGDMERVLEGVQAEAKVLREQVATLSARNVELERENGRLRETLAAFQQPPPSSQPPQQPQAGRSVAVSACLLVVCLFAFGCLFDGHHSHHHDPPPSSSSPSAAVVLSSALPLIGKQLVAMAFLPLAATNGGAQKKSKPPTATPRVLQS
jgi:hypothetical protein